MFLKQVVTCDVFFNWFTLIWLRIFPFVVSNKYLLIFQMSDFHGFIRRKDNICVKLSLRSFIVRNASASNILSTLCHLFLTSAQYF